MSQGADVKLTTVVKSAAAGDEAAFARIVVAYHDDMRLVCAFITKDHALAEDAVQVAWSIAWNKLESLREPERLRPWLVAIAANQARDLLRKRGRRAEIEALTDASGVAGGIDPATGVDSLDLHAALESLDPEDRALVAMRYLLGFDATELSAATGLSPSGTRTRLERLLARLRKELDHG